MGNCKCYTKHRFKGVERDINTCSNTLKYIVMTATTIGLSVISIIVILVAYGSCKAASRADTEIEKIIKKQQDEKTNLSR